MSTDAGAGRVEAVCALQRLTTQYVDVEDRIRVSGEDADGRIVVMWMSQRLLNRLVPAVCNMLGSPQQDERAGLLNSFEQQAAQAQLTPQEPVRPDAGSTSWLVTRVDLAPTGAGTRLAFYGGAGEQAAVVMPELALRQWLSILRDHYKAAEWPASAWPAWTDGAAQSAPEASAILH